MQRDRRPRRHAPRSGQGVCYGAPSEKSQKRIGTTDGAHNEYTIIINGVACSNDELPDVIRLNAAVAGPCQDAIVPGGANQSVTMTVVGTVISRGRWMCGDPAAGPTTGIAPTGT